MKEKFSLGQSTNIDDFSLGSSFDAISVYDKTFSVPLSKNDVAFKELQWVYDILRIDEYNPKDKENTWEVFFRRDAGIFTLLGKKNFKIPSETEIEEFKQNSEKWIACAHKHWISTENQHKTEKLTLALQALSEIYKSILNKPAYAKLYIDAIKKNLLNQVKSFIKQKIKDKILDVSEVLEVIDYAIDIRLVSDSEEGRSFIAEKIRQDTERQVFKIESFEETFLRIATERPKIERLNTEKCKKSLFHEYKTYYAINEKINTNISISHYNDTDLYAKMYILLVQNNLIVDNVELYKEDFFEAEKKAGKYNFSLPLNDEYFYYLKGTAIHSYQFTESQWGEFVRVNGLHKEADASIAFIMGTVKAVTIPQIAALLEENPNMALSRIRAGDLETYLTQIGQIDFAKNIASIKENLKNDTDILVQATVNILRGFVPNENNDEEDAKASDSLLPLIENHASLQELVSYLLRRKQFETLNKKILFSRTKEHVELQNYLLENGFDFKKLCMNYLHEFPNENNALAYKNMYETYARYVLSELIAQNDDIAFLFVCKTILEEGKNANLLSAEFMEKYAETEKTMQKMLDEQKNEQLPFYKKTNESKLKKSFFGFKSFRT